MVPAEIDAVDLRILSMLQENARTPFTKIAQELGVSDATIHLRVRKMENTGVIEKYDTVLNEEKMGKPVSAYVLVRVDPGTVEEVCKRLLELEKVYEISEIHERYDVLVKIRGSGLEEVRDILIQKIRSIPAVVDSETYMVFRNWKRDLGVRIEGLNERMAVEG
jgi:Lrp/AsnC family transcriptional regulator for asnA, asnC and gidA